MQLRFIKTHEQKLASLLSLKSSDDCYTSQSFLFSHMRRHRRFCYSEDGWEPTVSVDIKNLQNIRQNNK